MRVIFVSTTVSKRKYNSICSKRTKGSLDSSQKFFDMFLKGLGANGIQVDCISIPPISRGTYPGFLIKGEEERVGNICYQYVNIVNFPGLKTLFALERVKRNLRKLLKKYTQMNEEVTVICDPLLVEGTVPTVKMCKKYGVKSIGFLTDMPDFANDFEVHNLIKKLMYEWYRKKSNQCLENFDAYIFLTEAMSKCVSRNQPWMLLECLVEAADDAGTKVCRKSSKVPRVLYAGKLHKEFGMDLLAEAIPKVTHECEFHIYGDGNYIEELKHIEKKSVFLHGIVSVDEVMMAERESDVLVNPRTSQGEFTMYSFPSKTAEYMTSGVPVVMFRLQGIPKEYDKYLVYAELENSDILAKKIDEVLEMTPEKRCERGQYAREFILNNKNNRVQAKRVITFIEEMVGGAYHE